MRLDPTGHKSQLIGKLVATGAVEQSSEDGRLQENTARTRRPTVAEVAQQYRHKEEAIQRPDMGVQVIVERLAFGTRPGNDIASLAKDVRYRRGASS